MRSEQRLKGLPAGIDIGFFSLRTYSNVAGNNEDNRMKNLPGSTDNFLDTPLEWLF